MQSDPRRNTTSMAAAMGLMLAAEWGSGVPVPQSRTRRVAVVEHNDPPEVQQAAIAAAEAKRQRRAERNRKLKESGHD